MSYPLAEKAGVAESQVVEIWQRHLLIGTELATEKGEPIRIIYPGRINDGRGADFQDAVIDISRRVIKGDIEVHVKSSAWRVHRHHCDPAYNRVILHVVLWHNTAEATNLQNGKTIPVLALHKYVRSPVRQIYWVNPTDSAITPCSRAGEIMPAGAIAGLLATAGDERFSTKVSRFQADLSQTEAGQCLYRGIMGALGYSKNKLSCLELARRVPLRILESMAQGEITDEELVARQQALLLGTAGLLPSQRCSRHLISESGGSWTDRLESLWASSHQTEVMASDAWQLFRVRPINFPVRRIVAMSYLLLRYRRKELLEGLVNMVNEAPLIKGHIRVKMALLVTTNGYWASHFDFGLPSRTGIPNLLGDGRAADIAVNVLLPFMAAWSKLNSQPDLGRKAIALYRNYPRLAANAVARHMENQFGLSRGLVNSAIRQQGLIHIYNNLCTQGRCDCCALRTA